MHLGKKEKESKLPFLGAGMVSNTKRTFEREWLAYLRVCGSL